MTAQRKRGRPKGTGINDHETLLRIARILAADPSKKRTTAIKEIGVTNPSIIRRLRDKYQEQEESLLAQVHAGRGLNGPATERADPMRLVREELIVAAGQPANARPGPTADPLALLFDGLSFETLASQFIGHVFGMDANEIKNSPIPALIRQHAQLVDLILPLLASQFQAHKTVKAA